jgi:type II secretory pathway predicted ATPase ExeA
MLVDFYRFWEQPFGITPDSRSLYLARTHREALASLMCGIQAGRGFLALVAEPGMGKTTLLYQLMERLRGSARVAFLFHTQCSSLELFRYLMAELGLDSHGKDVVAMQTELYHVLFQKMLVGDRFVLIIDEAQNLAIDVLETVRLISNCETPHTKLMQIVLAGQPQLADKLTHPDLEQLRQRIAVVSSLTPFSRDETVAYIGDRLQAAGYRGGPLFTPSALSMIAEQAQGIPRNINMLCFNSLSLGYALKRKQINAEVVKQALLDLDFERLGSKTRPDTESVPIRRSWFRTSPTLARGRPVTKMRVAPWLFRAAVLLAMITVSGLFAPAGKVGGAFLREVSIRGDGDITSSMALQSRDSVASVARPVSINPEESGVNRGAPTVSPELQTVIVGPNDTILEITRRYLGRDDARVVLEIQDLNPQLTNINQIREGQSIRLPRAMRSFEDRSQE